MNRAYMDDERRSSHPLVRPATAPAFRPIFVKLTSEVDGGTYNWELFKGGGPATGQAKELDGTTGLLAGTPVILWFVEGEYWFSLPIETCP